MGAAAAEAELADALLLLGRPAEAAACSEGAVSVFEVVYGTDHPSTGLARTELETAQRQPRGSN